MGRLLSRATCSPHSFLPSCSLAERRRFAPTLWRTTGLGTRTGQGRKPRSGRAQARALTRSIPSPPASGGINLVKPTNDPSGAMPRARVIAPQPCIRWVYITRTMMQSCASAAKLRSGGPILPSGMKAKETPRDPATSNRHRRTVTRGRTGPKLLSTFSVLRSLCGTQNDAFRHIALPHEPPQGDQELARQGHDHGLACAAGVLGAGSKPLCQGAVLLEDEKSPRQLDHAASNASVARTGQPFLPASSAALVG